MDTDKAKSTAEKMLGQVLVTKQSGEGGKPVNTLYLASKLDLVNEMYFAILLDRATAGPMLIGCSEGGLYTKLPLEDMFCESFEETEKLTKMAWQQMCNFNSAIGQGMKKRQLALLVLISSALCDLIYTGS